MKLASKGKLLRLVSRVGRTSDEKQALLDGVPVPSSFVQTWDQRDVLLRQQCVPQTTRTPSLATQVLSGLILGTMLYAFCNVFASVVFSTVRGFPTEAVEIGISLNTTAAMIAGLFVTFFSSCPAFIAGPEINITILHLEMATTIAKTVNYNESAFPTTILAIGLSTLGLAFVFFLVGWFRVARYVQFVPMVLVHGFLACIGWEVLKTAVSQATHWEASLHELHPVSTWDFWRLLLPAIAIGVPLYIAKRFHLGRESVVFPLFLMVPLLLFHIICWAAKPTPEAVEEWMFPAVRYSQFWRQWAVGWNLSLVSLRALINVLPVMGVIFVIGTADLILKLVGSEKAMAGVEVDFDQEFLLAGLYNACNFAFMAAPGYVQAKFNVINYSMLHSTRERLPGIICALMNGILFFAGVPLLNVFPRFVLAGMLIFAGLAFMVENMYDTHKSLSVKEFLAIWVMVVTSAFSSILVAAAVGLVLSALIFAYHYAQKSAVKTSLTLADYRAVARCVEDEKKLRQLGRMALMMRLHGFIFFGSASQVSETVKQAIAAPHHGKWLRYVLLDFEGVTGIDSAGIDVLTKIGRLARRNNIIVLWSAMLPRVQFKLRREGAFLSEDATFHTFHEAAEWIESRVLLFSAQVRGNWLVHPFLKYLNAWWFVNKWATMSQNSLLVDETLSAKLERYFQTVTIPRGGVFSTTGEVCNSLSYLAHGRMDAFTEYDRNGVKFLSRTHQVLHGRFVNADCFFLRTRCYYTLRAAEPCTVLKLSAEALRELERVDPPAAFKIQSLVVQQLSLSQDQLRRQLAASQFLADETEEHEQMTETTVVGPSDYSTFVSSVHAASDAIARGSLLTPRPVILDQDDSSSLVRRLLQGQEDGCLLPELSKRDTATFTAMFARAAGSVDDLLSERDCTGLHAAFVALQHFHHNSADCIRDVRGNRRRESLVNGSFSSDTVSGPVDLAGFLTCIRHAKYALVDVEVVRKLRLVYDNAKDGAAKTGVTATSLAESMGRAGYPLSHIDVERLLAEAERTSAGDLDFDGFLRLFALAAKQAQVRDEVKLAFTLFVEPSSNKSMRQTITRHSLANAMHCFGTSRTADELDEMLFEADTTGTGCIGVADFVAAITQH